MFHVLVQRLKYCEKSLYKRAVDVHPVGLPQIHEIDSSEGAYA